MGVPVVAGLTSTTAALLDIGHDHQRCRQETYNIEWMERFQDARTRALAADDRHDLQALK